MQTEYMPECPMHKDTDGSPLKAIWRDPHGYFHCSQCLFESFFNIKGLQQKYEDLVYLIKEHTCKRCGDLFNIADLSDGFCKICVHIELEKISMEIDP